MHGPTQQAASRRGAAAPATARCIALAAPGSPPTAATSRTSSPSHRHTPAPHAPKSRMALSAIASKTGCTSVCAWLIARRISAVAVCRSSGLGEVLVARLELVEQAHVLDGDHRLVGEGLEQLDLLRRRTGAGARGSRRSRPIGVTPRAASAPRATARRPRERAPISPARRRNRRTRSSRSATWTTGARQDSPRDRLSESPGAARRSTGVAQSGSASVARPTR